MNLTRITNAAPAANPLIFRNAVWMEKYKPALPYRMAVPPGFNKFAILQFLHIVPSAFALSAFFVMGITVECGLTSLIASSSPSTLKIMLMLLLFIPVVLVYSDLDL